MSFGCASGPIWGLQTLDSGVQKLGVILGKSAGIGSKIRGEMYQKSPDNSYGLVRSVVRGFDTGHEVHVKKHKKHVMRGQSVP